MFFGNRKLYQKSLCVKSMLLRAYMRIKERKGYPIVTRKIACNILTKKSLWTLNNNIIFFCRHLFLNQSIVYFLFYDHVMVTIRANYN